MPKVTIKGETKHFPYTKAGKHAAKKAKKKAKFMMAEGGVVKVK